MDMDRDDTPEKSEGEGFYLSPEDFEDPSSSEEGFQISSASTTSVEKPKTEWVRPKNFDKRKAMRLGGTTVRTIETEDYREMRSVDTVNEGAQLIQAVQEADNLRDRTKAIRAYYNFINDPGKPEKQRQMLRDFAMALGISGQLEMTKSMDDLRKVGQVGESIAKYYESSDPNKVKPTQTLEELAFDDSLTEQARQMARQVAYYQNIYKSHLNGISEGPDGERVVEVEKSSPNSSKPVKVIQIVDKKGKVLFSPHSSQNIRSINMIATGALTLLDNGAPELQKKAAKDLAQRYGESDSQFISGLQDQVIDQATSIGKSHGVKVEKVMEEGDKLYKTEKALNEKQRKKQEKRDKQREKEKQKNL